MTAWDLHSLTIPVLYALTFAVALVGGLIPFVINVELWVLAVAALAKAPPLPILGFVTAGQILAKYLLYLSGRGALKLRFVKRERMDRAAATFEKYRNHSLALVAFSAVTGFPPFYGVSLLAGAVRLPLMPFLAIGTVGRFLRFAAVYLAPWYFLHGR